MLRHHAEINRGMRIKQHSFSFLDSDKSNISLNKYCKYRDDDGTIKYNKYYKMRLITLFDINVEKNDYKDT